MSEIQPEGADVARISIDDAGALRTVWDNGEESEPTITIEQAIAQAQRAKAIALRTVFKIRKRRDYA